MKTKLGIKIGADPEFGFKRNGSFYPANRVLDTDFSGALGVDGRSDTAELRPNPGSYYQVTDNISKLLGEASKYGFQAFAGSGDYAPLGGHIHFSGVDLGIDVYCESRFMSDHPLIARLDKYITRPLNTISDRRVRNHHYGHMGEVRGQNHGWEYRAPLSWLSTPIIAKGTLAIAWVLARAYKLGDIDSIYNQQTLLDYAYKGERVAIKLFFDAIKNYKDSNTKLESIEMFAAWKKTGKPKPHHYPMFSDDEFLRAISQALARDHRTRRTSGRYNPDISFKRIRFYGIRRSVTDEKVIYSPIVLEGKHLGAKVERLLSDDDSSTISIGLSYKLREDISGCVWTIKRIIKAINRQYEESL